MILFVEVIQQAQLVWQTDATRLDNDCRDFDRLRRMAIKQDGMQMKVKVGPLQRDFREGGTVSFDSLFCSVRREQIAKINAELPSLRHHHLIEPRPTAAIT